MEQCWAPNPAARPSFTEIASRLRVMSEAASQTKTQGHKASKWLKEILMLILTPSYTNIGIDTVKFYSLNGTPRKGSIYKGGFRLQVKICCKLQRQGRYQGSWLMLVDFPFAVNLIAFILNTSLFSWMLPSCITYIATNGYEIFEKQVDTGLNKFFWVSLNQLIVLVEFMAFCLLYATISSISLNSSRSFQNFRHWKSGKVFIFHLAVTCKQ